MLKQMLMGSEILSNSIDELYLPINTRERIYDMGIRTIGDLMQFSEAELLKGRNFGRKSLNIVKQALNEIGLVLSVNSNNSTNKIKSRNDIHEILNSSLNFLDISERGRNCLTNINIRTIGELAQLSERELLRTKRLGRITAGEIKEALAGIGLSLGMKIVNN